MFAKLLLAEKVTVWKQKIFLMVKEVNQKPETNELVLPKSSSPKARGVDEEYVLGCGAKAASKIVAGLDRGSYESVSHLKHGENDGET